MNLRHPLLHPPDPPLQPLSTLPVLLGRSIKFPLVVGDVAGQLVPLTLKGSAFIRVRPHCRWMTFMNERFARQITLFGKEGQDKFRAASVAIVGIGGLGTHVVQQLALLGVGRLTLIDSEELDTTNRNRYVGAWHTDPIPGSRKVDLADRLVKLIDPDIKVDKVPDSFVSNDGFRAIIGSDYVFGCLDSEGARLILNELCAACARPYLDLASDVVPGDPPNYGGRVCVASDGNGCIVCWSLLDTEEAQADLAGPSERRNRDAIYGVDRQVLGRSGPSVVSINGVVASLGVTEFMVGVTGLRAPKRLITYYGHMGRLTTPTEEPASDCYYCKGLRGQGAQAGVERMKDSFLRVWISKHVFQTCMTLPFSIYTLHWCSPSCHFTVAVALDCNCDLLQ